MTRAKPICQLNQIRKSLLLCFFLHFYCPLILSLLQNSLLAPFDKLRTGFDTTGRTEVLRCKQVILRSW
jgi:hypothetical protein